MQPPARAFSARETCIEALSDIADHAEGLSEELVGHSEFGPADSFEDEQDRKKYDPVPRQES
jgi:hypothetical protein